MRGDKERARMVSARSADNENHTLTLKNIYRLVTQPDFPVYTDSVFPREKLRNQTLNKFWLSLLDSAFAGREMDLTMFEQQEKRNRSLSTLMNRSGSPGFLKKWYADLDKKMDVPLFLGLVQAWLDRLTRWLYRPEALDQRLILFVNGLLESKDLESEERSLFFSGLLRETTAELHMEGHVQLIPQVFAHGVMMAWLTLYALYGSRMGDMTPDRFRVREYISLSNLYRNYLMKESTAEPEVLSARSGSLCIRPLPEDQYFGYRKELQRATEMLRQSGKLLVSGIGGIGKTEFVRRLYHGLCVLGLYQRAAFVDYSSSLAHSLARAFSETVPSDSENVTQIVRNKLENGEGRAILLIDNLDSTPEDDPELNELATYGCDIVITSRLTELSHFSALRLTGLDPTAGSSLFLSQSRQTGSTKVKQVCELVQGHPLVLSLLGKICADRFWSTEKLLHHIQSDELSGFSVVRAGRTVQFADLLKGIFRINRLESAEQRLSRFYAIMPYTPWMPMDLEPFAADVCNGADVLADLSARLCYKGMLSRNDEGYSMHPLIAEAIRLEPVAACEFPKLWACLTGWPAPIPPETLNILLTVLKNTAEWDEQANQGMIVLEKHVQKVIRGKIPMNLFERHDAWLKSHPRKDEDTAEYLIASCLQNLMDERDPLSLRDNLRRIQQLDFSKLSDSQYDRICGVLEFAWITDDAEFVDQLYQSIRPAEENCLRMADYLISRSVILRQTHKDSSSAIQALREAAVLLDRLGIEDSMRQANLDYRLGTALMDLDRIEEACPLIRECLELMRKNGVSEHSASYMSTQGTYAVLLLFTRKYREALSVLEAQELVFMEQGKEQSVEYTKLCNNKALVLDGMKRYPEAEAAMRKSLETDARLSQPPSLLAAHNRNMAYVLFHAGKASEALPYAEAAVSLRRETFGDNSPWTADAQAVMGGILSVLDRREEGIPLLKEAVKILEKEWGPKHRHTLNAKAMLHNAKK